MLGKIIELDKTYAFILFTDGSTIDINRICLPSEAKVGDRIDICEDANIIKNNIIPKIFF